jgi:glycosyltransferase involved in cell wall biosynthesis
MSKCKSYVIICSHNGEEFIKHQIDSIYETNADLHVLVYDFDSHDSTLDICNEYSQQKNFTVFSFKFALGAKASFIFALSHFKKTFHDNQEDYLLFLSDQDDIWKKNKYFEVSIFHNSLIKDLPQFVHHNVHLINSAGVIINKRFYPYSKKLIQKRYSTLYFSVVIGHTVSMNKKFMELLNDFDGDDVIMHDWGLSIIADLNNCRYYIDEMLSYYRIHTKNTIGLNNSGFNFYTKIRNYFVNCYSINKQRDKLLKDFNLKDQFLNIFKLLLFNFRLKLLILLLGQKFIKKYD